MGGEIEVESRVGIGSVFTFTLRVGLDERAESRSNSLDRLPGKRVLVVEASPRWREVIGEHLKVWGIGYEVAEAGAKVLDQLTAGSRAKPFDVMVIGMDVRDISVSDLIKRVRNHPSLKKLPIILLTTLRSDISLSEIEREFVTHLQKPIRFSELYNCLAGSLSGSFKGATAQPDRRCKTGAGRSWWSTTTDQPVRSRRRAGAIGAARDRLNGWRRLKRSNRRFPAVLMDCQMPVMDGYTATREIRQWERETNTRRAPPRTDGPRLVEARRVLNAGMDDYSPNPFGCLLREDLGPYIHEEDVGGRPLAVERRASNARRS
jgi:CheY-like chemotaxis protein